MTFLEMGEGREDNKKISWLKHLSFFPPRYLAELKTQQEIKHIHLTKNCLEDVMCDYRWLILILEDWSPLKILASSVLFIYFFFFQKAFSNSFF